jgi:hypothetical protein
MQHGRHLTAFAAIGLGDVSDATLQAVAARAREFRHLALYGCNPQTELPMQTLALNCHNLWTLELGMQGDSVPQEALVAIVKNLKSVIELSFEETQISDEVLMSIPKYCRKLRTLHLTSSCGYGDTDYTLAGVAALAQGCESLQRVCAEEDDVVLNYEGRRLWQAHRPDIELVVGFVTSIWLDAVHDIEKRDGAIW